MLWSDITCFCNGIFVLMLVVLACAFSAYYVDSRRADDDPNKKNYHPLAILFAPITFPIIGVLFVSFYLLRVLFYAVFLILFIFALMFIHKPFVLEKIQKAGTGIGDRLLEANTFLIRFFLNPYYEKSS